MDEKYYIIDFDSTFIKNEALELLAEISLKKDPLRPEKITQIRSLTTLAMNGKIRFDKSLKQRIELINAHTDHIELLIKKLKNLVSVSIKNNRNFFRNYSENIFILSGGFKEYIIPIVSKYNIPEKNVFANTFITDKKGFITGFDVNNFLAGKKGKVNQIKALKLKGEIIVIGDGYTDYELKKSGLIYKFYAFTENIERKQVSVKADHVTPSFDEFLYVSGLPMTISYPKNRIKVLLLENIHKDAVNRFKTEGYNVEVLSRSISERELAEKLRNVSVLGIRSKTVINRNTLKNSGKLMAIGAFCVGVNQIELEACSKKGIIVFNAPYSNTRSVVELVVAEIIMLMRGIINKNSKMHKGIWDKTSVNSNEVRGKKLGIIGYGKIGSQLSVLAEDMGMDVYYYDVLEKLALGNAKKCATMKELLKKCDVITLHVDGSPGNKNLVGDRELRLMKDGSVFLNLSRGNVVDLTALKKHLHSGKIKGAAIDVFPHEPVSNSENFKSGLKNLPNVLLTPHIGGSTDEAQKNIAGFVPGKIIDFINSGNSFYSVNFPNIQLPPLENAHRLIHIHHNVPGILAKINTVFARHNINITGQYLKTDEITGYVITDISKKYNPGLISELKEIERTIKFRILY